MKKVSIVKHRANSRKVISHYLRNTDIGVEIDIWYFNDTFYVGHDYPEWEIPFDWLCEDGLLFTHLDNILLHAKSWPTYCKLMSHDIMAHLHFFYHSTEPFAITSKGMKVINSDCHVSTSPFLEPIVMRPERLFKEDLFSLNRVIICTDLPEVWRSIFVKNGYEITPVLNGG